MGRVQKQSRTITKQGQSEEKEAKNLNEKEINKLILDHKDELKNLLENPKQANDFMENIMGKEQFKKMVIATMKNFLQADIDEAINESEDGRDYNEEEINEILYEAFISTAERKSKERETDENLKPVIISTPKNMVLLNDKISRGLPNMENNTIHQFLEAFNGQDINAILNNDNVKTNKPLERWDIHILESVISLFNDNNDHIEEQAIKRLITQSKERQRTQLNEDIIKSLDKLQETFITINYTNPKTKEEREIKAPLLPMIRDRKVINGSKKNDTKKDVYIITSKPPIMIFIELMNKQQLITAENKLLDAPIKKDKFNINITLYLISRVKDMQNQQSKRKTYIKTILYDTLFKECDILQDVEDPAKVKKQRTKYRKIIKDILQYYKQIDFIKDYAEVKEGKEYNKISITL